MSNTKQPWSIDSIRKIAGTKQLHEGRMAEVDQILQDVASGELDAYTVMNNPKSPEEQYAAQILQQRYDAVATDHHLHADDQFEEILDIVCDQLAQEYGMNETTVPKTPSKEVMEMRNAAGLPMLTEKKADDEPDEPNETAIAKRKRLQALKDKQEDERMERGEDDKPKSAVRTVQGKAYGGSKQKDDVDGEKEEKPAKKEEKAANKKEDTKTAPKAEEKASGGSAPASEAKFAALARSFLAHNPNASAADVRAHCIKAGCTPPAHFHSRLSGIKASIKKSMLKKGVKEGFILIHPQMPSFVLAENMQMNQYHWISMKDSSTALEPLMFVSETEAKKVMVYVKEYKNQSCILTPVKLED